MTGTRSNQKHYLRSARQPKLFTDFCERHATWRSFADFVSSEQFVGDLNHLLLDVLRRSRGIMALRRWNLETTDWMRAWRQTVTTDLEFSRIGSSGYIMPHTDTPSKLVSLLLYFPDQSWQNSYGGSTEFYRPKRRSHENNWANRSQPFSEMLLLERFNFVPNRLVGFVKSRNSYHGVSPISCPEGMTRDSLNINIRAL